MKSLLAQLRVNLLGYKIDPDLLDAYRSAIPQHVNINISQENNHFIATINTIEHHKLPQDTFLITEANSNDELVDKVNDLILTYKKIPELYRPYYKRALKPEGSETKSKDLSLVKA